MRGFTIIEMMVVVAILGIITTVGSNLFFTVLRGSTKTKVLQLVKQNGGYAVSVMGTMIRNARKIESSSGSSLTITNPDGRTTIFSCSNSQIASNGSSLMANDVKVADCANFFTVTSGEEGVRPDRVQIKFTLSQSATGDRPEDWASVDFQTTVGLRNY